MFDLFWSYASHKPPEEHRLLLLVILSTLKICISQPPSHESMSIDSKEMRHAQTIASTITQQIQRPSSNPGGLNLLHISLG